MSPKSRKIAIMGYRSVGKSSLTIQFVENHFVDSYDPTIENTFHKTVKLRGQEYHLMLVDTAGQDEYSIFPLSYTMDIHGYVLVYAIDSTKSFEVVKALYEKLLDMTGKVHVPIVLVGNKVDLRVERVVSYEEGKQAAEYMKAAFLEASAKQYQSVSEIFSAMVQQVDKADGNVPENKSCVVS
ncbi:GTP-binding protein Rheb-like [Ornithodoros turicata]|uniref:Putative ras-related gtpase n=1 Tax=Ornithodoros turicata TaxID=34597 RepID=A0A2R5L8V6_9ACAR